MGTSACLTIAFQQFPLNRRIRQKPKVMVLVINLVVKVPFIQIEAKRNGTHNVNVKIVASLTDVSFTPEQDSFRYDTLKKSSIVFLKLGASVSSGHWFFHAASQSRPISIVSLKSGAFSRRAAISLGSADCVTRSRPMVTYPRFDRGSSHFSLS